MKQESRFGAHVGTSSLLLIFLTLSLISFGALSLAGAIADKRLSDKLLAHTQEYYTANHEAEAFLARTDTRLRAAYKASADEAAFLAAVKDVPATCAVPMNDTQQLVVELEFVYPDAADAARCCRIVKWRVETADTESYVRHLPVSGSGEAIDE